MGVQEGDEREVMSDISVNRTAAIAVTPTDRQGGQARDRRRDSDARARARREAIVELLEGHGVPHDEGLTPILEVITDADSGATRIRVWDERTGAVVAEVSAEEFAAAAAAHQAFEGLLVERNS